MARYKGYDFLIFKKIRFHHSTAALCNENSITGLIDYFTHMNVGSSLLWSLSLISMNYEFTLSPLTILFQCDSTAHL